MRKKRDNKPKDPNGSLAVAFSNLSDGVVTLVRQHLDLFREEAKRDVKISVSRIAKIGVGVGVLLIGWIFLNFSIVLAFSAWFGIKVAAIVALIDSVVHLCVGGVLVRKTTLKMKASEGTLLLAKQELERSSEWVKQIKKEKPNSKMEAKMLTKSNVSELRSK